jgi:hypothetical protein
MLLLLDYLDLWNRKIFVYCFATQNKVVDEGLDKEVISNLEDSRLALFSLILIANSQVEDS